MFNANRKMSKNFLILITVEELLNNTKLEVVVFTGNLDLIVDTPGTVEWVDKMNWVGAKKWKTAPRKSLVVNKYVEGYVKNVGNLYLYWVHRAGHMVIIKIKTISIQIFN